MSENDHFKEFYKNQPARARLAALRAEMVTPLATIQGYATLLERINLDDPSTFPKDYSHRIARILEAQKHISYVLDALTSDLPDE